MTLVYFAIALTVLAVLVFGLLLWSIGLTRGLRQEAKHIARRARARTEDNGGDLDQGIERRLRLYAKKRSRK